MTLRNGRALLSAKFNKGISYRSGDIGDNLFDSLNLVNIQGKLTTRPGKIKYSVQPLGGPIDSISQYIKADDTKKLIAKAGTQLVSDDGTGNFNTSSPLKTGLTTGERHDAVTMNNRHIMAIHGDGLYSYDGTTFEELGISTLPTAPTITDTGTGDLPTKDYVCKLTYYCSDIDFESNAGAASSSVNAGGEITVSNIPTSTHALVDYVNVYLRNEEDDGSYLYIGQVANGTSSFVFSDEVTSTQTPPIANAAPVAGGAKYFTIFNRRLVASGNSTFQSDVFFSNTDQPDGWDDTDTAIRLFVPGSGPVTGLATGSFTGTDVNQYLVIFKKRSCHLYYRDLSGNETFMVIDRNIGCVSHQTIHVKDGNIYFMSDMGWRYIRDGELKRDTLGKGDIDDIFRTAGESFSVNKANILNAFSVYYGEFDSYMTWISEGTSTSYSKCYNYHFDIDGFLPLQLVARSAYTGEDNDGNEKVFIGDDDEYIYQYSVTNERHDDGTVESFVLDVSKLDIDKLQAETQTTIPVNIYINWKPEDDLSSSYNFRDLHVGVISDQQASSNDLTIKTFVNFKRQSSQNKILDLTAAESGFTLDISRLDVDVLADNRARVRAKVDLNQTGFNIMVGMEQDRMDATLQLLEWQLEFIKNGNLN